jgi:hypothetical protein
MTLTFPMVADTVGEFLREFSLFNTDDKSTQTLRVTMQVMHYPLPPTQTLRLRQAYSSRSPRRIRGKVRALRRCATLTMQVVPGSMSTRSILVFDERGSNGTAAAQPPLAQATNRTWMVAGADAKYLVYPFDEYGNRLQGGELLQV